MAISMMLLTDQRPIGYLTSFIAPILMVGSVWFWIDLNEELDDFPSVRALPLTTKFWRWALSGFGAISVTMHFISLPCVESRNSSLCQAWLEVPQGFHQITERVFGFLFGANWSEPVAAFVGYLGLIAYVVGLLQWLLIRLPKQGRIAGEF